MLYASKHYVTKPKAKASARARRNSPHPRSCNKLQVNFSTNATDKNGNSPPGRSESQEPFEFYGNPTRWRRMDEALFMAGAITLIKQQQQQQQQPTAKQVGFLRNNNCWLFGQPLILLSDYDFTKRTLSILEKSAATFSQSAVSPYVSPWAPPPVASPLLIPIHQKHCEDYSIWRHDL